MKQFVYIPYAIYFSWMIVYFIINFWLAAKRIEEKNYLTMYTHYYRKPWGRKILDGSCIPGPIIFVFSHFIYFSISYTKSCFLLHFLPEPLFILALLETLLECNVAFIGHRLLGPSNGLKHFVPIGLIPFGNYCND